MPINIDENNLKQGVLGLVIALTEIIRDALKLQAFKRMEGGTLTDEEMERLGEGLMDLDIALEEIKEEQGVGESVKAVRDGLDEIVDEVVDRMLNPERWAEDAEEQGFQSKILRTKMKETKEVIKSIVQQEMSNILAENQEIIKDVIKTSLLPELRAIIRNNIFSALEDLMEESAGAEKKLLSEKDNVTKESVSEKNPDSREPAQPSVTETPDTCCCNDHVHDPSPIEEDASISVHDESVNSSSPETTDADLGEGRYLYCLVEGSEKISLGKIGIEGNEVYTIPYRSLCAVVHDCPAEPYKSDDQEVMTNWVLTHQQVTDQAWEKFGSVLPLGFDTIIQQKEEISPDENTKKWLEEEYDSLKDKFEKIRGKAEYGIQIFWDTKVIAGLVSQESEEIKNMEEEMNTKPKGIAYMYKQKLESLLKTEMEEKADKCFKDFYERIRSRVDEVKIEKIKKDEEGRQMLMNFTCLLPKGKSEKLGDELETINNMEGFSVRFTGPWPPYGFV